MDSLVFEHSFKIGDSFALNWFWADNFSHKACDPCCYPLFEGCKIFKWIFFYLGLFHRRIWMRCFFDWMISIDSASKEKQGRINHFWIAWEVLVKYFEFYVIDICNATCIGYCFNCRAWSLHAVLCQHFGVLDKHLSFTLNFMSTCGDSRFECLHKGAALVAEFHWIVCLHDH